MSDLFKNIGIKKTEGLEVAGNYKTVGLVGLCAGAGTTQLAIMLAVFYSNGLHKRTAVVSVSCDGAFDKLRSGVPAGKCKNYTKCRQGFSYKGIDFFCNVRDGFVHVIDKYYDVVIVKTNLADMTVKLADGLRDAFSCECKIMVGSMLDWKYTECIKRLERIDRIYDVKGLKLASVTWQKRKAQEMARELGVKPLKIPYEENPFFIKGSSLLELRRFVAQ